MENNEFGTNVEVNTVEEFELPKYVEKSTLEITETPIALIMYKPKTTLLLAAVFAGAFILMGQLLTILLGVFIFLLALFVQFKVDDFPTLEIYKDYVLIYKLDSHTLVRKVNYDDVEEWTSMDNEGKSNCVVFRLKNGEKIYKDTFQSSKAYRELKKLMEDKESRVVQHRKMVEKNKKVKMKFKLPFKWPFGNKK